jgi:hypothetical protein
MESMYYIGLNVSGRSVSGRRHLVRKLSTDDMRVLGTNPQLTLTSEYPENLKLPGFATTPSRNRTIGDALQHSVNH